MRVFLYGIILILLIAFTPIKRLDVADLEPVQTVAVRLEENRVVLETDTGNRGEGDDIKLALENLEETTPGVIYLDTAEYLLITEDATKWIVDLQRYLSSDVKVSLWDGKGPVDIAARYLNVEKDLPELDSMTTKKSKKAEKDA